MWTGNHGIATAAYPLRAQTWVVVDRKSLPLIKQIRFFFVCRPARVTVIPDWTGRQGALVVAVGRHIEQEVMSLKLEVIALRIAGNPRLTLGLEAGGLASRAVQRWVRLV